MVRANVALSFVSLIMRWIISFRYHKLVKITAELNMLSKRCNLPTTKNKLKLIYVFGILTTFLHIPVFVCTLLSLLVIRMKVLLFLADFTNSIYLWILIAIFAIFNELMLLPINTFAIYYTIVCHHLKLLLVNLSKSMINAADFEQDRVYKKYLNIKKIVMHIDEQLSFLVFLSSISNACTMHFGLTIILHPEEYFAPIQMTTVCCLFASNYLAYIGLILSGSLLYEASKDLWRKMDEALISRPQMSNLQQRLLSLLERGLFLTVWKIVPITRTFIFSSIGTVFSYCILLDNLESLRNIPSLWNIINDSESKESKNESFH
ncbi:uncharacterized protein NPIL_332121 [Nephila pilipes]|uniref:Gustatory receptor n=1 Tax=Nephila pilipes TaxID=299642 RepID=A0A8X6QGD0_NEPPI|nr:uncharacterized protein NPIL_332121 [Nephila pilipes]